MNKIIYLFFIFLAFFAFSCEKSQELPDPDTINPYIDQSDLNGFTFQDKWYKTPFGILEIWGENNDESADFDLKFTDGTYKNSMEINQDSVLVYLDMNSPELSDLSEGKYYIQTSTERTPNSVVEAYILFNKENTIKLQILGGEVEVEKEGIYFLIRYDLETIIFENNETKNIHIIGQYTGEFNIYNYSLLK